MGFRHNDQSSEAAMVKCYTEKREETPSKVEDERKHCGRLFFFLRWVNFIVINVTDPEAIVHSVMWRKKTRLQAGLWV